MPIEFVRKYSTQNIHISKNVSSYFCSILPRLKDYIKVKIKFSIILSIFCCINLLSVSAQNTKPDTVKTGIYITSIHDIDFKEQEYTIDFWLWLKYKNPAFDFSHNLEIPLAKSVEKSYETIDTTNGVISMLMKFQCVMKDSWQIDNFPFDKQTLRLSIENSQYDSKALVFLPDKVGQHYDPRFALHGWAIDSFRMSVGNKAYETAFGDESAKPHTEYSAFRIKLNIDRDATGLFWKLFIGMYVAFLIAFACFFIHADSIDSRFSLSVGSLFAVIGNKYIVDGSLPETVTFTLVDTLHGLTLLTILCIIAANIFSLKLIKNNKPQQANKFDVTMAGIILGLYIILNTYFIVQALG